MTMEPKISKKGPCVMEMQPGKYFWCSCGHSAIQPFCDGAHNKL
ncbi:MAG: CDGSH iron-sulfur domain-containing protein [Proteobacteria bacterium]|nr:CDGSH iron-sulfur domain-containing protein [Pseudomonadota bacterium]